MKKEIEELLTKYKKIAIFSGAGVSTESGIKDFRGKKGLYNSLYKGYTPQKILSRYFFQKNVAHKALFFDYIKNNLSTESEPNSSHYFAKKLFDDGKLSGVITQNIDGLYQKTGLDKNYIVEIHGNLDYHCVKCRNTVENIEIKVSKKGNYLSPCCDFQVETNIVLYGDNFDSKVYAEYLKVLDEAELLIVQGTSLEIVTHKDNILDFQGDICLMNDKEIVLESWQGKRVWDYKYIDTFNNLLGE